MSGYNLCLHLRAVYSRGELFHAPISFQYFAFCSWAQSTLCKKAVRIRGPSELSPFCVRLFPVPVCSPSFTMFPNTPKYTWEVSFLIFFWLVYSQGQMQTWGHFVSLSKGGVIPCLPLHSAARSSALVCFSCPTWTRWPSFSRPHSWVSPRPPQSGRPFSSCLSALIGRYMSQAPGGKQVRAAQPCRPERPRGPALLFSLLSSRCRERVRSMQTLPFSFPIS